MAQENQENREKKSDELSFELEEKRRENDHRRKLQWFKTIRSSAAALILLVYGLWSLNNPKSSNLGLILVTGGASFFGIAVHVAQRNN